MTWRGRAAVLAITIVGMAVVWFTNQWLTQRFTETTRNRAEVRQVLYSGNLLSELQRNSVVPLLLSRDPELINALNFEDYTQSSQRLISYVQEIGAASLLLLDETGRVVGATDRNRIGSNQRSDPYFIEAQRSSDTVFSVARTESGGYNFYYSRKITRQRPVDRRHRGRGRSAQVRTKLGRHFGCCLCHRQRGRDHPVRPNRAGAGWQRPKPCQCNPPPRPSSARFGPPPTGRPCHLTPICKAKP